MASKFLMVIAAILAVFGLLYLFSPQTLAETAGLTANASGLTDIRATYGGFQIGLALFLFWSCRSADNVGSALVATGVIFACVGLGRLYGVIVDGEFSGFNMIGLMFEVFLTAACAYFYQSHKRLNSATTAIKMPGYQQ